MHINLSYFLNFMIFIQWIPSCVYRSGNEVINKLVKHDYEDASTFGISFCFLNYLLIENLWTISWLKPFIHHEYNASNPDNHFLLTVIDVFKLSRLVSGHLTIPPFIGGRKIYVFCTRCHYQQASSEHILKFLGFSRNKLFLNFLCFGLLSQQSYVSHLTALVVGGLPITITYPDV